MDTNSAIDRTGQTRLFGVGFFRTSEFEYNSSLRIMSTEIKPIRAINKDETYGAIIITSDKTDRKVEFNFFKRSYDLWKGQIIFSYVPSITEDIPVDFVNLILRNVQSINRP